ncbi:MAG: SxtJ family membrane protein [Desulfocapsaceae bacterium]|nr:SxtJ family membrane protein [Desulfocapsaceae bacterium]
MNHNSSQPDKKELRNFSLTLGIGIALIFGALLPWRLGHHVPVWPWVFLGIFSLFGLVAPFSLKLPYRVWMRFGLIMNAIMSRLILGVLYYLTVLPIGLILKMSGKDSMGNQFDKDALSYRVISKKTNSDQMRKPF